jgi:hypothetical protein
MNLVSVNDICFINKKKEIMIINNNSNENILLIGSCRITPFLNYLINDELFGNKYNYLCVLVYMQEIVELSEEIINNKIIKSQICNSTILIAEYIKNYNYFNTDRYCKKCIFKICDSFQNEIILPNWSDICLYTKDLIKYKDLKDEFNLFINKKISLEDLTIILQKKQEEEIERHNKVLTKAKWLELINYTSDNYKKYKLSHTINHPTNLYFIEIYRLLIEKNFAESPFFLPQSVIDVNFSYEFLKNDGVDTKLTYYDKVCLGFNINTNYLDENESNIYLLNESNI